MILILISFQNSSSSLLPHRSFARPAKKGPSDRGFVELENGIRVEYYQLASQDDPKKQIMYACDLPHMSDKPYEERWRKLHERIFHIFRFTQFSVMSEQKKYPDMKLVHPVVCQSKEHFDAYFEFASQSGLGVVSCIFNIVLLFTVSQKTNSSLR